MRLIDADELMKKVNSIKYLRKLQAQKLCNECTEIEAIPIKWLENYIENSIPRKEHFPYWYKRNWNNRLRMMIDDWRKENG